MKKRRLKKKFIVFFYIYALILSSFFITKTFSKYTSNFSKNGNIEIAEWNVSATIPDANINLIAGNNTELYTITVNSESEVGTDYSIVISNIPANVQVALDNNNFINATEGQVEFNNAGSINANASTTTNTHVLKIKALIDAANETNRKLNVSVTFTQKQTN